MTLDDQFGPPIPPQSIGGRTPFQAWEDEFTPTSLTRLNDQTAVALRHFMKSIEDGWQIGEFWITDTVLIWAVDLAGQIRFAVEELVLDGNPAGVPKHQTMPLTSAAAKLGHPALVGCQRARIAGEILFDATRSPAAWVINNRSGRYGIHPSRRASQLARVADRFATHGIQLVAEFI